MTAPVSGSSVFENTEVVQPAEQDLVVVAVFLRRRLSDQCGVEDACSALVDADFVVSELIESLPSGGVVVPRSDQQSGTCDVNHESDGCQGTVGGSDGAHEAVQVPAECAGETVLRDGFGLTDEDLNEKRSVF